MMINAEYFIRKVADDPALALRILRTLAGLNGQATHLGHITVSAGLLTHDTGPAVQMLDRLCETGAAMKKSFGWCLDVDKVELERLALIIEGAMAAQACHKDKDTINLVITYPGIESSFMELLRATGPFYASVPHTSETFVSLSAQARERLVVMTPFLDRSGAMLIGQMFSTAAPGVKKTLIVRKGQITAGTKLMAELAHTSTILDYMVSSAKGPGSYETFHSKVILADSNQAYIGSANFVASSLSLSLELGVAIRGESARMLARFIDSIISRLAPIS